MTAVLLLAAAWSAGAARPPCKDVDATLIEIRSTYHAGRLVDALTMSDGVIACEGITVDQRVTVHGLADIQRHVFSFWSKYPVEVWRGMAPPFNFKSVNNNTADRLARVHQVEAVVDVV